MRCKAGDLAMVVRGYPKSRGHVITCVRLVSPGGIVSVGGIAGRLRLGIPTWIVDPPVWWEIDLDGRVSYVEAPYCADECLMPINPLNDEQDVTPTEVNHEVSV